MSDCGYKKNTKALMVEQERRRKRIQDVAKLEREKQLANLLNYEKAHPCDFCRDLPRGPTQLKYDCGELYGLIIDDDEGAANNGIATCPKCGDILVQWE